MPRLVKSLPSYCKHRASGQAVVTVNGKDIYLGAHGTRASKIEYDRVIAEYLAAGRRLPVESHEPTVNEIVLAFWKHAKEYYRKPVLNPDGSQKIDATGKPVTEPTTEVRNLKRVLRPLRRLYGHTPAREFGPLALKAFRQHMIQLGWCRKSVNSNVARVKMVFKWAVAEELVPASVHHGLIAVSGLKAGRSDAIESDPVKPVSDAIVEVTLPFLSRQVKAMVEFQLRTGARPGEVCMMRSRDIDTSGEVWTYRPLQHKTSHHGHERIVLIGPRAQEIIRPFLKPDLGAFIFSPKEAEEERRRQVHARRKTPMCCGNVPGSNRSRRPKRQPGDQYTAESYRRAIARSCDRAFKLPEELMEPKTKNAIESEALLADAERAQRRQRRGAARKAWRKAHVWHPHQLRHNAGTRVREDYDAETAQVVLGLKHLKVTEIYAEKNLAKARRVMAEVG